MMNTWGLSRRAGLSLPLLGLVVVGIVVGGAVLAGLSVLVNQAEPERPMVKPGALERPAPEGTTAPVGDTAPAQMSNGPIGDAAADPWLHIRSAPLPAVARTLPSRLSSPIAAPVMPGPPPVMTPTDR